MRKNVQIVSLDWLEVRTDCYNEVLTSGKGLTVGKLSAFPQNYGTKFFSHKYEIKLGTRVVASMVTSPRANFIRKSICLVKLSNNVLYTSQWRTILDTILHSFGLILRGITRLDVCCDQLRFADGRKPHKFIRDFVGKDANENGYIHRYGSNKFSIECNKKSGESSRFSYIRFGSRQSNVQAYIYNKSKELREVKDKPYIREMWEKAGLVSEKEDVWRAEISIKSQGLNCVDVNTGELLKLNVSDLDREYSIQAIFSAYAKKYLSFGVREGQIYAKDYTKIKLFSNDFTTPLRPRQICQKVNSGRMERIIANRLVALEAEFPNVAELNYNSLLDTIKFFYNICGMKSFTHHFEERKRVYAETYVSSRGLFSPIQYRK